MKQGYNADYDDAPSKYHDTIVKLHSLSMRYSLAFLCLLIVLVEINVRSLTETLYLDVRALTFSEEQVQIL